MVVNHNKFVVITGASKGLGKAFARNFAARGYNLIVLSLPGEELSVFCNDLLEAYKLPIHFYETDLREGENIRKFVDWVLSKNFPLCGLVNCAAMGITSGFGETDLCQLDNTLMVNLRAMTLLSRLFVPVLMKTQDAFILNFSVPGLTHLPNKTVHPASRSFVYSLSVGLGEELKNSCIQVSVVNSLMRNTTVKNSDPPSPASFLDRLVLLELEELAEIVIHKLLAGNKVIHLNLWDKVKYRIVKFFGKKKNQSIPIGGAEPRVTRRINREVVEDSIRGMGLKDLL